MGVAETLSAVGGWGNVTAGTLLIAAFIAVLRGRLVPPGLVRREDMDKAIAAVQTAADGRVADAHARVADHERRADKAEQEAAQWRDVWRESERGRRLAAEQTVAVLTAAAPVSHVLTQEAITTARAMTSSHPPT